jgi:hypothetical protein
VGGGGFETASGGNINVKDLILSSNYDDSAIVSPLIGTTTHHRNRTINVNPASISVSYRRAKVTSQPKAPVKPPAKLKPFSKTYMAIALEHDQRIRGSKSPISIRKKPVNENRTSLRNSKEIQIELE